MDTFDFCFKTERELCLPTFLSNKTTSSAYPAVDNALVGHTQDVASNALFESPPE